MNALERFCAVPLLRRWLRRQSGAAGGGRAIGLAGLSFRNPVGLAAGFDKNARWLRSLEALGFGFVEIGTVTPRPQPGNDKPRLFRLPADRALINRMGFNNDGAEAVAARLRAWRSGYGSRYPLVIGGNIGKNKTTPNEDAAKDYETCFLALWDVVDYFVVNVSSPNTPGLRALQDADTLRGILLALESHNGALAARTGIARRPVFLKLAPDLSNEQTAEVVAMLREIRADGLVLANTTLARQGLRTPAADVEAMGAGGLSGAPLRVRSTAMIRDVAASTGGSLAIIGSGGIFNGQDAREKIEAGAALVQVYTGFVYEGPFIVRKILGEAGSLR